jgi:ABC-type multidrug transport system fused ATPase/permease subunit
LLNRLFKELAFYINEYYGLLGNKMFLYLVTTIIPAFFDGIGITMIVPLLNLVVNDNTYQSKGNNSDFAYRLLQYFNIDITLNNILLFILSIYVFKFIISFSNSTFRSYLISLVVKKTRFRMYSQLADLKFSVMQQKSTGFYTNLAGVQLSQYISGFAYLSLFFTALLTALSYLAFSLFVDFKFSLLASISGGLFSLIFILLNKKIKELSIKNTKNESQITSYFIETIQSFKYLKSTNGLKLFLNKLEGQIEQIRKQTFASESLRGFFMAISEPLIILLICFFIYFQVSILGNSLVGMLLSIFLFHRALTNIMVTQKDWQFLMNISGGIITVSEQLKHTKQHEEKDGLIQLDENINVIEFKNVTFAYNNHKAINNVSLKITGKSSVAFVGESGAGKTTLADLCTLLYTPTEGEIFVNNTPATQLNLQSYRSKIGLVTQDVYLYDDTIANNIALWAEYDEKKLIEACKQAHALDFINQLPDGFNTQIGDRGLRLSGGQKQRLSLARELYKKPSLLILDEATSALDSESESFIKETLDSLKGSITIIMIAHRLSTIKEANQVVVLKSGSINDIGTFDELANRDSYFQKIIQYQQL